MIIVRLAPQLCTAWADDARWLIVGKIADWCELVKEKASKLMRFDHGSALHHRIVRSS